MGTNKAFWKKLIYLLVVMGVITVTSVIICGQSSKKSSNTTADSEKLQVVTSFYPMYILTKNLLRYNDVSVSNMTPGMSGCLHDYQVTTEDMRKLSEADIFVVNGMGMESFLERVAKRLPHLSIYVASGDMDMDEEEHDHQHHDHEENGHLWMNPHSYLDEFNNLHGEFNDYFLENGSEGDLNALFLAYEDYGRKILALMASYDKMAKEISEDLYAISFNEAFEVFADGLGINLIGAFSLDEDEMPSAGEIADSIKEAKKHEKVLIFIEKDQAHHAKKIVDETGAEVVFIDPLTSGAEDFDSYIKGMEANMNALLEAIHK